MRFLTIGLILLPLLAEAKPPKDPELQPGDTVSVRIPPEKAVERTIDKSGQIQLKTYGKVTVGGMSLSRARRALKKSLSSYLRNTSGVKLELVNAGRLVLITGAVAKAGTVRVGREADVWQAINAAGGPGRGADLTRVALLRDGKRSTLNVSAYLAGSRATLPLVRSGDTVFVPTGGSKEMSNPGAQFLLNEGVSNKIFVLGAVTSPGMYDRMPDLDAVGALALAGGPKEGADLANLRVITRDGTIRIDATAWLSGRSNRRPTIPESGGAIVYVPNRGKDGVGQLGDPITVVGAVGRPGQMSVPAGTKLIDAVGMAGGPNREGDMADVRLVSRGERFTLATYYDLEDFMDEGGFVAMVEVKASDVIFMDKEVDVWRAIVGVISDIAVISAAFTIFATL